MSSNSDEDAAAADAVVDFMGQRSGGGSGDLYGNDIQETGGAMIDLDGFCYADYIVKQYAAGVLDFSSQYGSDYSISYTAPNITGRPSKYPEYGDFPETFAMRTYGDWWNRAPSRVKEIQPQNSPKVPVHDFIVLYFEDYTIPDEIAVFETFNPGALVRIWAYTIAKTWICLWEASDFLTRPPYTAHRARRFAPPLRKLNLPTKTIRLEFNHSRLNYFTEIDAVMLTGKCVGSVRSAQQISEYFERQRNGSIVRKLKQMQFRPDFRDNYENCLHDFFINDLNKFMGVLSTSQITPANVVEKQPQIGLKDMPFDIVLKIFSYLDLISLFHVGQVNHFFYEVATHPLLYIEINLKPYWHLASSELLCTLARRATVMKKLDLSWCGLNNSISPTEFKKLIQQRGYSLTHLRLDSCKFLNASCIETLGLVCDNLKELSLRNCATDPPLLNFSRLTILTNLERLDLFQTNIEPDLLLTMLENNRRLKHLNLAFCPVSVNMDHVAEHVATYNQQLISLDMWKSHSLSAVGLQALCKCHDLEEVDFGWCLRLVALGDSLKQLLSNCPKLKKLFLATVRGMTDQDVQDIANLCPNLEQLDLMGVLGISKDRYHEILVKCKKLQLLDLSFCENIDENEIAHWMRTFKVQIKRSHVPLDFRY